MQTRESDREEPEYIEIPLEAQVQIALFLYNSWQQFIGSRLHKYLTFPQWLFSLKKPNQMEVLEAESDFSCSRFSFCGVELLKWGEWGFGAALSTSDEYSVFDVCLGFFTLIWICDHEIN